MWCFEKFPEGKEQILVLILMLFTCNLINMLSNITDIKNDWKLADLLLHLDDHWLFETNLNKYTLFQCEIGICYGQVFNGYFKLYWELIQGIVIRAFDFSMNKNPHVLIDPVVIMDDDFLFEWFLFFRKHVKAQRPRLMCQKRFKY